MSTKKYWKSLDQLENTEEFQESAKNEFPSTSPVADLLSNEKLDEGSTNRRDFLKFLGFSVTAASLAACETPVRKAIPYLNKPEEITPGVANWYASTYADGSDYASIMVKTREGRPILIEGNKLSQVSKGGLNARVAGSVLSLYDTARLTQPLSGGTPAEWSAIDSEITAKLQAIDAKGGIIKILTNSIISPSTKAVIADFKAAYPNAQVEQVVYDAVSFSGTLDANQASFGKRALPDYHFDKANVVVGFGADFLENWPASSGYVADYAKLRSPKSGKMSKHFQFETNMSLTGSNADVRKSIKPSEHGKYVLALYNEIASAKGASTYSVGGELEYADTVKKAAAELLKAVGKSVVISGSNDVNVQTVVNAINYLLGNYGATINLNKQVNLRSGDDKAVTQLVSEMKAGSVDALFIYGPNPSYTLANATDFNEGLSKVGLSVSFSGNLDETASLAGYVCPDHHYLEAWNDANPKVGQFSLAQPTIRPLFNTRAAQESLLAWAGKPADYYNYIKSYWATNITADWNKALHNGVFAKAKDIPVEGEAVAPATLTYTDNSASAASAIAATKAGGEWELELYVKAGMGEGQQANNPILQEFPDPISRVTWDNYITMSPKRMKELGLNHLQGQEQEADVVELTANGVTVKAPVCAQPGQKYGTIGLALGYGRTKAGKCGDGVGVNAFPLISWENGVSHLENTNVTIKKTGEKYHLAATQTHHTMMGRDIVKETTLAEYVKDNKSGNPDVLLNTTNHGPQPPENVSLWDNHDIAKGHRWGMSIDLNACIGCGACVVNCSLENNVPVVGKDEVRRMREMHWLRIDRYYTSDMTEEKAEAEGLGAINKFHQMEDPSENPQVSFQPVMCQHCNHAPCETVCPVAATTHSNEGLNQMTYNRCIGTRYCANNCPYKVRRFNWFRYRDNDKFDFHMNSDLGKMVLNPDVIVRERGVIEKCSLCVQRIQAGKLKAKKAGRKVKDGEIQTACSAACTTGAIKFGDLNDDAMEVTTLAKDPRSYNLLAEVGVQPNVYYMTKVRNIENEA